jgi:hypothetical protein
MSRTTTARRPRLQTLTATVTFGGTAFPFQLFTRPLELGPDLTVRYYWMDSTQFRITRARRRSAGMDSCRNCVAHWWRAMQVNGWADDLDQIRHLLLAECYALVGADKGLQHVYRDAHLAAKATKPEERSLPDDVRARVQAVVRSRDASRVREELDCVLGAWTPPPAEERAVYQAIDGILEYGVGLVRAGGADGLHEFIGTFDAWCAKTRRKGGQPFRRRVLDGIAYLSKCSFYLCYCNAWISLIPWLREHQGLDDASERFLRFWHMQQQPAEEAGAVGDVSRGQVLSLHPLSGFFMLDRGLCAVAGRLFAAGAPECRNGQGASAESNEYWDLVGAILAAAHLYRQALDEQAQKRGTFTRNSAAVELASVTAQDQSAAGRLEDFAREQGVRCERCGETVRLHKYHPSTPDADEFRAEFACRACGCFTDVPLPRQALEDFLSR